MHYRLQDLIDLEQFQLLQDRLNNIYSFPSAIIDLEGNILTATAWQEVCTRFHRANKESEHECIKSDQYISRHLHEAKPAISYRCPHGLIDNATPIIIDGVHYGNYFTGQFFLEPPDLEFFKAQPKKYGFDEAAYLAAVKKVPVWTREQLDNYLFFIKGLIEVISGAGQKSLQEREVRSQVFRSEERHHTILQTAMDGFWTADMQGRLLEVNNAYCLMSGYSHRELRSMHIADLEAVQTAADIDSGIQEVMREGGRRFETRHRRKDGSLFDVEVSVQYLPAEGGQCVAFLRDISDRKHAEAVEARSRNRLSSLVRILQYEATGTQDFLDYALHEAIEITESTIGYIYHYDEEQRQFILNSWSREVMKECAVAKPETCCTLDKTGIWGEVVRQRKHIIVNDFQAEHPLKRGYPDGHVHLHKYMSTPVFSNGRIVAVVGVANKQEDYQEIDLLQLQLLMDSVFKVLHRREAEAALLKSEQQYRSLLENVPAAVYRFSTTRGGLFYSPQAEKLLGCSLQELYANPMLWNESIHPDDRQGIAQVISNTLDGRIFEISYRLRTVSGEWRWILDRSLAITSHEDEIIIEGIAQDITELKAAEERAARSLKEKTVMLQEIHHRVKNNMQIICSLLNLQAAEIADEDVRARFDESRRRVSSMAMIHDKLYQSEDLSHINFEKYLQGLTADIAATYSKPNVRIEVEMQPVALDINVGIPCGLIVNELISNSLKYAFPSGEKGVIRVGITTDSAGDYLLFVEDNGIGFPAAVDFRNTSSLGLILVNGLTRQLHGNLELSGEGGSRFTLTFPKPR